MSITLKVKAVSLAMEAKYIKKQEQKLLDRMRRKGESEPSYIFHRLKWHRKGIVAWEARKTNLARGFIKGLAYKQIENKVKPWNELGESDFEAITKLIQRHRPMGLNAEKIKEWVNA